MTTRVWETTYRHDRRNHRHRCVACNRILNEGDYVTMWRQKNGKCKAMHADCTALIITQPGDRDHPWTYAQSIEQWAIL